MSNSERNNFEEQWRKVFEDASMKPPAELWDGIETELDKDRYRRDLFFEMMDSGEHNFEKQWQNVFENATTKPSPALWENIEAELDEERRRRPVFFFLRPSYLAAGIAALLLMIWGGVVLLQKPAIDNSESVAVNMKKGNSDSTNSNSGDSVNSDSRDSNSGDSGNSVNSDSKDSNSGDSGNFVNSDSRDSNSKNLHSRDSDSKDLDSRNSNSKDSKNSNLTNKDVIVSLPLQREREEGRVRFSSQKFNEDFYRNDLNNSVNLNPEKITQITDNQLLTANTTEENRNQLNANLLNSKNFDLYKNRFQPRKYLTFDSPEIETKSIAQNESKFWVGVQSGVSPFNPNLNLDNIQTSASAQAAEFAKSANQGAVVASPSTPNTDRNFITVGMPKNQVRSGIATNFGFATGYQLNKKWAIESGLRYFSGNSNLLSNTYSINEATGQVNAFFADYVANNQEANTIVADAESYNNRYQYLMIPVQASYQIPIRKSLNMSVLGGFSTDIFLQNAISSAGNFVSESKVNQGIYRTFNLSGLGGVRANYLLNKHWQANLGVNYQQALFSGFKVDNLNMRFQTFGLQYGLNYRF
jgi:hypothetical protein